MIWPGQIFAVALIFVMGMLNASNVWAESSASTSEASTEQAEPIEYKLTLSHYSTQSLRANDVNLRVRQTNQTGWLGYYKEEPSGFEQLRGGYERTDHLLFADIDTSLQAASHGFLGGSITASIGTTFFGLIGYGCTNLKPYTNLNFDPNDAITLGVGWKREDGASVTWFVVRDDRVVPGQQNFHWLMRSPLPHQQRVTLDLFLKNGPADPGQSIRGIGTAITYDWSHVFMRLAYDPKVNFTQESMTRLSLGMRF